MDSLMSLLKKLMVFLGGIFLGIIFKKLKKSDEVIRNVPAGVADSKNQVEVEKVKSKDSIFVSDNATSVKVETKDGVKTVELAEGVTREKVDSITAITPDIKVGNTNIDKTKQATDLTPDELSNTLANDGAEIVKE